MMRRPQIRLKQDEPHEGPCNDQMRHQAARKGTHGRAFLGDGVGHVEGERQFGEFRRLEGKARDAEPPGSAADLGPHPRHQEEQQEEEADAQKRIDQARINRARYVFRDDH